MYIEKKKNNIPESQQKTKNVSYRERPFKT